MFIQRTNDKSCVLDAFANATGILASDLIALIGHDGSEHGFHVQELIEAMDEYDYSVTEIQLVPVAVTLDDETERDIIFPGGNMARFCKHLWFDDGVLLGMTPGGQPHAVAWRGHMIIDSAKETYYVDQVFPNDFDRTHFDPHTFLKIRYE